MARIRARANTAAVIVTEADIAAGVARLRRLCPGMAMAFKMVGHPPLRRWSPGFDGLVRIIVGQQLSTASANAIFGRLALAVAPLTPERLLATEETALRAAGLSAGKIATLRAVAAAGIDFESLPGVSAEDVRAMLTAVRGVGPWTADIYLMFCRGDADAFAAGDLALQIGAQHLLGLEARPTANDLMVIAERWRPYRAVAARMLWAYYGHRKMLGRSAVVKPGSDEGF